MLVAGIDSSTQSTKVVVVDVATGDIVREGKAPHPDGSEVHPDHWWQALNIAMDDAGGIADCGAVSIAGQQHGMVCLDDAGEVIRPALLWNDVRSAQAARDLIAEKSVQWWVDTSGSAPVASLTVTKLRWLADNEPENAAKIAAVCLPHDWLMWKLSGSTDIRDLVTDRSDASGTGYVDVVSGEYRRDILALALRISEEEAAKIVLPRIADTYEKVGTVAGTEIAIGPGCGDNAGAALALNLDAGKATLSIGTSGVVAAISPEPVKDMTGAVNGFMSADGNWLPLACTLNASLIQDYMRNLLDVSYDELDELAIAGEVGSGGMTMIPFFVGERTPNLPDASASIHNMRPEAMTRENLARLAYEGLACSLTGAMDLVRSTGARIDSLLLVGGGAKSAALRDILPAVLGVPIEVPRVGEYVALGAALQAARVLNPEQPAWPIDIVDRLEVTRRDTEVYERYKAVLAERS
ncbi:MAG: xylulose kinase [Actinomycetaceae bacterium]|nr:xylulose kinase [Actinomycetaceae bacterium]